MRELDTRPNIISKGKTFGSTIPDLPQRMTVTHVTDTEVQFTRRGVSGIFMMPIDQFCKIGVVLPGKSLTRNQYKSIIAK